MAAVAQHTCKGSSPRNSPTDNAAEGILLDCCCDAWDHGMPPNAKYTDRVRYTQNLARLPPCHTAIEIR